VLGLLRQALWNYLHRYQQLIESDSMQHLGSHSIYHGERHFGAIMRGIDVQAKGTLPEWHVDDLGDRIADLSGIGIGRYDRRERFHDLVCIVSIRAGVVLSYPSRVCGVARMREMIRPTGECSWNDD
jgi:hypothetical protein